MLHTANALLSCENIDGELKAARSKMDMAKLEIEKADHDIDTLIARLSSLERSEIVDEHGTILVAHRLDDLLAEGGEEQGGEGGEEAETEGGGKKEGGEAAEEEKKEHGDAASRRKSQAVTGAVRAGAGAEAAAKKKSRSVSIATTVKPSRQRSTDVFMQGNVKSGSEVLQAAANSRKLMERRRTQALKRMQKMSMTKQQQLIEIVKVKREISAATAKRSKAAKRYVREPLTHACESP